MRVLKDRLVCFSKENYALVTTEERRMLRRGKITCNVG
jgi:hypothetical protein